jgi:hypothetical protein
MTSKKDASTPVFTVGDTVGHWTVIGEMKKQGKKSIYPCRCVCGTEMTVAAIALANETSLSCGCDRVGMIASQAENLKLPDHLQVLFDLISEGRLPPADGFSIHSSDPTWNLASIAKLIGVSEAQLIRHLNSSAPRFSPEITAFE